MLIRSGRILLHTSGHKEEISLIQSAFDALSLTIAVISAEGTIRYVNQEWRRFARANGIEHAGTVSEGVNYLQECRRAVQRGDGSANDALEGIQAVIERKLPEFEFEYPCDSPGEKRWFLMNVRPVAEGEDFLISHFNITKRKDTEAALYASEKKYRELYEDNPTMYFTVEAEGTIVSVNKFGAGQLGYKTEELVGQSVLKVFHPEDRASVWDQFQYCLQNPGQVMSWEFRKIRKDGTALWVRESARVLVKGDNKKVLLVVCEDVTDRKSIENKLKIYGARLEKSNQELRLVPSKLIAAQEEERRRLSTDLHDSVGQTLAALKYRMEHIVVSLQNGKSKDALKAAEEFIPTLQQSIDEIRNIYMGLHPSMLDNMGLIATLGWLRSQLMRIRPECHVELTVEIPEQTIPQGLRIAIFRIVQEGLNNVLKHSRAHRVEISLSKVEQSLELIISDDGVGMDPEQVLQGSTARGLGLTGMQERAELTDGRLSIHSSPDKGTSIRVCWPIRELSG